MGDTSDEVAETLRKAAIKGRLSSPSHCPLTRYLRRESGIPQIVTCKYFISIPGTSYKLPDSVEEFVKRFDDGQYPELVNGEA